ncbi:polymerase [Parker's Farm virus]|nr:polymerase [Parker's Farm virus]
MDPNKIRDFRRRINDCEDPDLAKEIADDLLVERHNYFNREFCEASGLIYMNDVPSLDICLEVLPPQIANKVRHCTPDNYVIDNGKVYIIDFKVSVDDTSSRETKQKYESIFGDIFTPNGIDFEVVIIRLDPIRRNVMIDSISFQQYLGPIQLDIDINWYNNLKELLYDKFKEDERFLEIISHGEFTLTLPWIEENTPELFNHPIYEEFINSMDETERQVFIDSVNFRTFGSEKWNSKLKEIMGIYNKDYQKFVKTNAQSLFNCDGNYPKPSKDEISSGWKMMVERIKNERDMTNNMAKEKPSFHFIWARSNSNRSNENNPKIIYLAKALQKINTDDYIGDCFKTIGHLMDFSTDIEGYEKYCAQLKNEVRSTSRKIDNKKIPEFSTSNCTATWEQQFKMKAELFKNSNRINFIKNFLGIGGHKNFSDKLTSDLELDKPTILDFEDTEVISKCKFNYNSVGNLLKENSGIKKSRVNIIEEYKSKIINAKQETWENIDKIMSTNYWEFIVDYSTLMKNMLSVSQYNKHNTFRIVTCANNSVFGVVFPSSDIKTRKATLLYCIVVLHKDKKSVCQHGGLYSTFQSGSEYISISKAFRLDKERCQRIVTSPGLFLMTSILMYNNNNQLNLHDVLNFSLHTSTSITKAMLSLTEPSRYMIMNSLAISSHVKDYIAEKFSPYTKTGFSVYMTQLIKSGCYNAFLQKDKIELRDIYLTDYDITQKGPSNNRDLNSIWFPGKISLKEYINQIYMPFYFNSKGLHEKHHVLIDLAKTVLEIERDQRLNIVHPWSEEPKKQTVNLKVLIYSLARNLLMDTSRHNFVRSRIENSNNFKRKITTVSTFTSSKSCIKVGDFENFKAKVSNKIVKSIRKDNERFRIANPELVNDEEEDAKIKHCSYDELKKAIPNYTDYISTKVFDRLYEKIKMKEIDDTNLVECILKTMKEHKTFYFGFFNKGQKTAKDREIFVGEYEAKMCLYLIERISKERCKLNPEEMISEPGDSKLKKLEQQAEQELRYMTNTLKSFEKNRLDNVEISDEMKRNLESILDNRNKGVKLEINADMSKWSAQDVMFKYFWLFALDPILYPEEKKRILYFLCNYMQKKLILPDELMNSLLDQKILRQDDILSEMTGGFRTNTVEIKKNWLQGNMNYTSSYLHTCSMAVYKDVIKEAITLLEGECLVNSMVHSDDNQTSLCIVQSKVKEEQLIQFAMQVFENICMTFGNQANMKKTYLTLFIKEFVSLFNIYGEPFSIYGRFLMTAVGDCAYLGPYEDMASRLSATQTAIKHGCPASYAWLSIALNQWMTFNTYNMLPGQINDPLPFFPTNSRHEIPIELCGFLNSELSTIALTGLESDNLTYLTNLMHRMSNIMIQREPIQNQYMGIEEWDLTLLSEMDQIRLKLMRYVCLDSEMSSDDGMGETSDMRSRSLLTPRKFTTISSLAKLISYHDFIEIVNNEEKKENMFNYFLRYPELLVTKGETYNEYLNSIIYRYNSKKFKESLSIQNPAQLFIEQILFSSKPVIDYTGIHERIFGINEREEIAESTSIVGKKSFKECFRKIVEDLNSLSISHDDIKTIYSFMLMNDPLLVTCANSILLSIKGTPQDRLAQCASSMPEMRSMKLIYHSPAVVIRSYIHNKFDFPNVDENELKRDVMHLEIFIEKVKLKEKMESRINEHTHKTGRRDLMFELRETTKFYQICYDYIKSTEHKVKIFILPFKTYTCLEFCSAVIGNLQSDDKWHTMHYLKNIVSTSHKAQIATTPDLEYRMASECLRLICHFSDTFLAEYSRIEFVKILIDKFTYHDIRVSYLFDKVKSSRMRTKFMALLFHLNELDQNDINRYDAEKSEEKIIWNNWQKSREMSTGPIDLIIQSPKRMIKIVGQDDSLVAAEMQLSRLDRETIHINGQSLLNKPHGLKFEKMRAVPDMSDFLYYIVYQQRAKKYFFYSILPKSIIIDHNNKIEGTRYRSSMKWVPVCPVVVQPMTSVGRTSLADVKMLNYGTVELSRIQMAVNEYQITQRCSFQKMTFFNGPNIESGVMSISNLMKSTRLLTLKSSDILTTSLLDLCRLFICEGDSELDELEFLSDEPLDIDIKETLECNPILNISYNAQGCANLTYRKAIRKALEEGIKEFEDIFDMTDEGFYSNQNLSLLEMLHWLIVELKTNQWSTDLDKCIHLCMLNNRLDSVYHMFDIPKAFLKDPIERSIWWLQVQDFVYTLEDHKVNIEPWKTIFEHFVSRAKELVHRKLKEARSKKKLKDFASTSEFNQGRSKFDF